MCILCVKYIHVREIHESVLIGLEFLLNIMI
jgi:hypothetical protein